MTLQTPQNIDLQNLYEECLTNDSINLSHEIKSDLNKIVEHSEKQKGVLTVIVTGLFYKYYCPEQDVRKHQSNMEQGYSGRTFDTKFVTPFMKANQFPAMAESGWLTRSLEQNVPYDFEYTGSISGKGLKIAFLNIYNSVEKGEKPAELLSYLFQSLVKKRDATNISLSAPVNLTIQQTLDLVQRHFNSNYKNISGASRLPSLAIYSIYSSMMNNETGRYKNKTLCSLESHTASDSSTGSIGDIQINEMDNNPFEGIEIKAKPISLDMLDTIYTKIQAYETVTRYYLLTTHEPISSEISDKVTDKIDQIRSRHGCEVVVNGVFSTMKYFLRMSDTASFLKKYAFLMQEDDALKYEHKKAWNDLCSKI